MKQNALLQELARRIARIERAEHRSPEAGSMSMPAWGEFLTGSELPAGSLIEFLAGEEGVGLWTLALFLAGHACGTSKILVIADAERRFYPPGTQRLGIDLRRTVVIRPKEQRQALVALTQALRCGAVGAAIGRFEQLSSADFRRLQVAAETGGGIGFLLRPLAALQAPSFAGVRLRVSPAPTPDASLRRVHVEVVRFRGSIRGQSMLLEIDDETGHVRVSAAVASAESAAAPARSTG